MKLQCYQYFSIIYNHYYRQAIFAPSLFDNYASSGFPGITDLLFDYEEVKAQDKIQRENELKKHVSDLTIMTHRAISMLTDFHQFD